jgi:Xaa-Pro aminopeptidase
MYQYKRFLKSPISPSFSYKEYRFRLKRMQDLMKENNVDVLMLTNIENIIYSTGYQSWYFSSKFRPVVCFVPLEGEPIIVVRVLEKYTVEYTSWVNNIWCWGSKERSYEKEIYIEDFVDICTQAIKDLNVNKGPIGIEAGESMRFNVSLDFLQQLKIRLGEFKFSDGSNVIQLARMLKSEDEVKNIKTACQITEEAIEKTIEIIKPGITEKDISRFLASQMTSKGIDKISYLTVISGKNKYPTFNAYATDRKIEKGDLILFDISGHYNGYASDLSRGAVLGKATQEQKDIANVSIKSVQGAINHLMPGKRISEINKVAEDIIIESGFEKWLLHSSGHGIGLDVVEYPFIHSNQDQKIEEGMVLSVEQGVYPYDLERGVSTIYCCFRTEDNVFINKEGAEYLSGPDKGLVEII